jgi:hypothetical protein
VFCANCDAVVGVVIFSSAGKLYDFCSPKTSCVPLPAPLIFPVIDSLSMILWYILPVVYAGFTVVLLLLLTMQFLSFLFAFLV